MLETRQKTRVGVVGAGFIAQLAHLNCFKNLNNCDLVAIAELRPELRRRVADKYDLPIAVETHHELIDRDDIDAIIVVTRRNATGPIVLDALNAGKHVLSEKPMAHTSAQAERLSSAAHNAGVVYQIGFMKRCDDHVAWAMQYLAEKLSTGILGQPRFIRCYSFAGDGGHRTGSLIMTKEPRPDGIELWRTGPNWLNDDRLDDYDQFLNIHSHIVNLSRYLIAIPLTVCSFDDRRDGTYTAVGTFGKTPCVLEFADSGSTPWHEGIEIFFESGHLSLQLQPPFESQTPARLFWTGRDGTVLPLGPAQTHKWQFQNQAAAFIEKINKGKPDVFSADDGIKDLIAIEAMWRHVNHLTPGANVND